MPQAVQQRLKAGTVEGRRRTLALAQVHGVENGVVEVKPVHRHDDCRTGFASIDGFAKRRRSSRFTGAGRARNRDDQTVGPGRPGKKFGNEIFDGDHHGAILCDVLRYRFYRSQRCGGSIFLGATDRSRDSFPMHAF